MDRTLLPRKAIRNLRPCFHGGVWSARDISKPENVIDLSVSINPFGPPKKIKSLVNRVKLNVYPDMTSYFARRSLADYHSISPNNIVIGNGSSELIQAICFTYLSHGDRVVSFCPTFDEYRRCSQMMSAEYVAMKLLEKNKFTLHVHMFKQFIKENNPKIIFLCNPNNPTGYYFNEEDFREILLECSGRLVVLDEAYVNFVQNPWNSVSYVKKRNVIILKSMTKDYALTALRVGYCIADERICTYLYKILPPWNVNSLAQEAIRLVIKGKNYLIKTRKKIKEIKSYVQKELQRLNIDYIPSEANFILIKIQRIKNIREFFLKKNILIRDCSSYGLNHYIRVAIHSKKEMDIFLCVLRDYLAECL